MIIPDFLMNTPDSQCSALKDSYVYIPNLSLMLTSVYINIEAVPDLAMCGPWAPSDEEALKGQNRTHDLRQFLK